MALTTNGNRTGRAGATDRRDRIEYVRSKEEQAIHDMWEKRQDDAILCCIALEGEEAFMKWYMDDNNVPAYGRITERIALIRAHHAGLEFVARYTMVDRLVGEECADIQKIADIAESIPLEDANG